MTISLQREAARLAQITMPARIAALGHDEFEGYASLFGVPDQSGDVVARGAFANSLGHRGPPKVRMLYQHFAHEPIGVWQAIREDARGLYVKGRLITDTQRGPSPRPLRIHGRAASSFCAARQSRTTSSTRH